MRLFIFLFVTLIILTLPGCKPRQSPSEHIYNKGVEYQFANQPKEAVEQFKKALAIDPKHEDACLQLAYIYEEQYNDKKKAIEYYNRFLEISSNERLKENVKLWIEDAKASLIKETPDTKDAFTDLDPITRKRVKKIIAEKEEHYQKLLEQRDKKLKSKDSRELESLKETLGSYKLEIVELKDKVENLTIERNDLQKKVREKQTQAKIAEVLDSPELKGGAKKMKQNLIELKSEYEGLKVQLQQEKSRANQLEEENVKVRQQLAKARKIKLSSDKTKALTAQVKELEEKNRELADQLKIMESSKKSVEELAEVEKRKDDEIKKLQEQILGLKKERTDAIIARNTEAQKCVELEEQIKELIKHSDSLQGDKDFINENRELRLQIAKLTTQYNDMSIKKASFEQQVNELENELESYKKVPQAAKPVIGSEFKDLSEEILQMQSSIAEKDKQIEHKDKQIDILKEEFNEMKSDFDKFKSDKSKDELIEDLNKKLSLHSHANRKLKLDVIKLNKEINKYKHIEDSMKALTLDMKKLNSDISDKNRIINELSLKNQKYNEAHKAALVKIRKLEVENRQMSSKIRQAVSTVSQRSKYPKPTSKTSYSNNSNLKNILPKKEPISVMRKKTVKRRVKTYRVRRGDSLSSIAARVYGDKNKWQLIYSENRDILSRPNSLKEGQILIIPLGN